MKEDRARAESPSAVERRSIVVLMGGLSAEHDVSVVSGWAIADALSESANVERIFIDLGGAWWRVPASAAHGRPATGSFDDPAGVGGKGPFTPAGLLEELAARPNRPIVFPALHGPFGEDGTVQALLEAYDLPYAGAGVAASAIGMDKVIFKRLVAGMGIPVVEWLEVSAADWRRDRQAVLFRIEKDLAEVVSESRFMIKPACLGSLVGMTLAHSPSERPAALEEAFRHGNRAIVERYVEHPRELEVAVIGNDPARLEAFGPGEVYPGHEFYDYVAKYTDGVSRTSTLAALEAGVAGHIREMARQAYAAIGCEGYARLDFLMEGAQTYLSEINTIPGFTPISLFPQMASTGLGGFGAVCRRIVELAVERHESRVRRRLTAADLPR